MLDLDFGSGADESYGEPASYTLDHSVTIVGSEGSAILRNVTFKVPQNVTLTLAGSIVVDDVNLSGLNLTGLVKIPGLTFKGIPTAIDVAGGRLNLEGTAHVASGANGATHQQRAIAVTADGSEVNLNSAGDYDRSVHTGLDLQVNKTLEGVPFVGSIVKGLNELLSVLTVSRKIAYPTVWGRDAAIYSEPHVANATINISNGTYSNQKDSAALGKTYLNGAVSSSAKVNIIGSEAVKISNTKIGNSVDSDHNGSNTTGTLNISNPEAELNSAVENDTDAQAASTDSWALELCGNATVNLVAGSINDTLHNDDPKIIESESTARVNILPTAKGAATIAERSYWIDETKASGAGFTAQVNADASSNDTTKAGYELWHSDATKQGDTLTQLQNLVAKEAAGASEPTAAKLSTSSYSTGRISASYPDVAGQAVYGREVISSPADIGAGTIFDAVNDGIAGTVVLYGQPWADTYTPGGAPEQTGSLFAGWYTSQTKFGEEDTLQATPYKNAADSKNNPKHHAWDPTKDGFNGTYADTIVVDTAQYSGTLYPHFVSADTMSLNYQVAAASKKTTVKKSPYASEYDATIEQGDARYLATTVLKNVPTGRTLTITPKWVTLDGTVVTGSAKSFTVPQNDNGDINE